MKTRTAANWPGVVLATTLLVALSLAAQQSAKPAAAKKPAEKKPTAEQEGQAALASAQLALDQKQYDAAISLLENFLESHPQHAEGLFNLAYAYTMTGRTGEALDTYRQSLEADPKLFPARFNLGILLLREDKPAEAAEELVRATELEPENYRAHLYAAIALERSGRKEEALAQYRRAAELDPKEVEPRRAALGLLLEKNDLTAAQPLLEELLALEPQAPDLLRLRADIHLRQERPEQALAAYEDFLKVKPDDAAAHLALGRLYHDRGKTDDALRHFEAAERAPDAPEESRAARRERAALLAEMERWAEVLPVLEKASAAEPKDAELHAALGFALLQLKQYPRAAAELQAALSLDARDVKTYDHLASALYLAGDYGGAIGVLDQRARLAEETPGTLFLRAVCYDKLAQCAAAMDYYQRFLALNRDTNSDAYFEATGRMRLLKNTCKQRRR
ncbi:MAG TPA: tetratricopeptide repeat protein [Candidatus Xenobia bacterium]|nr:tetratricopeptide repeat protein [Candidatus Xenobia bacterium]